MARSWFDTFVGETLGLDNIIDNGVFGHDEKSMQAEYIRDNYYRANDGDVDGLHNLLKLKTRFTAYRSRALIAAAVVLYRNYIAQKIFFKEEADARETYSAFIVVMRELEYAVDNIDYLVSADPFCSKYLFDELKRIEKTGNFYDAYKLIQTVNKRLEYNSRDTFDVFMHEKYGSITVEKQCSLCRSARYGRNGYYCVRDREIQNLDGPKQSVCKQFDFRVDDY